MGFSDRLQKFNKTDFVPQGWFWLIRSEEVPLGQARPVRFIGRELAVYRGQDGIVRAFDAYCPHMGAHLGNGMVEGNSLRCLFHNWKYGQNGECLEIPCQKSVSAVPKLRPYVLSEKYGLVWVWTGSDRPIEAVPEIPELKNKPTKSLLGNAFEKNCHPNVVMINAIDAHHFNTVHNLVVQLNMQSEVKSARAIRFANTTSVPQTSRFGRLISRFYKTALTYDMTYWYGHVGSVTLGPDFLHFHIMFALRPTADGKTQGQTILVTPQRTGWSAALIHFVLLQLTKVVGNYFAKGDTIIFSKIKFDLRTPVGADGPILEFIKHYEHQDQAGAFDTEIRESVELGIQ